MVAKVSRPSESSEKSTEPARSPGKGKVTSLATHHIVWLLGLLIALVIIFTIAAPAHFLTAFNMKTIAMDASYLVVLSVGQAFVVMSGGIDLSVGSVLVFSTVIIAKVLSTTGGANSGWPGTIGACAAGFAVGGLWGLFNGMATVRLRLPALIVTLATSGAVLGLAQVITNGNDISNVPNGLVESLGNGTPFLGIPWLTIVALVVVIVAAITLQFLRFGRYTLAAGSNSQAATRAGINVRRHVIWLYVICGLLAGLAGVMSLAQFSSTTITSHSTDSLSAIAAVVLGGTSLYGGRGSIIGAVVGALIPAVLADGFVLIGFPSFWEGVVVGAILLIAVLLDRAQRASTGT